jgi:hypothetical protein
MALVTGKIMFFIEKQDTPENNHFGKKRYKNGMDVLDMKVALSRVLGKNTARRM